MFRALCYKGLVTYYNKFFFYDNVCYILDKIKETYTFYTKTKNNNKNLLSYVIFNDFH